jgi:hypothetical protein
MKCGETWTILMMVDGKEKNWCQRCKAYHDQPSPSKQGGSGEDPLKSKSDDEERPRDLKGETDEF